MYKSFHEMPDLARLWTYQAHRRFTPSERDLLEQRLRALCEQWSAHGTPLHTSFALHFDQFVILAVDERQVGASGCSIDGTVRLLKNLQHEVGLDFFDREKIAFLKDGRVELYPLGELKTLFESHALSGETITFNNTLTTKAAWVGQWKIPVKDTWLTRYLPKTSVVR